MQDVKLTNSFNTDGHYSVETKVSRPKISIANAPILLPGTQKFSDKEANRRMSLINNDIYLGTKKEKSKYEFNKALFFKIFAIVGLVVAGIVGFDKIKKFFRKS